MLSVQGGTQKHGLWAFEPAWLGDGAAFGAAVGGCSEIVAALLAAAGVFEGQLVVLLPGGQAEAEGQEQAEEGEPEK